MAKQDVERVYPEVRGPTDAVLEDTLLNPNETKRSYDGTRFGASHGSRGVDVEQGGRAHSLEAAGVERTPREYDSSGGPLFHNEPGENDEAEERPSLETLREDQPKSGGRGRHPVTPTFYGAEPNEANAAWTPSDEEVRNEASKGHS